MHTSMHVCNNSHEIILAIFKGKAGDSLSHHNGMKFSTQDVDNDRKSFNCAELRHGAWWFDSCDYSHLNGDYLEGFHDQPFKGVYWHDFKGQNYSYKVAEMKVGRDQN